MPSISLPVAGGALAASAGGAAAAGGASTLATISAGAGLAGAGISAIGTLTQGAAASRNAQYQAQVQANNAVIAQQNAAYAAAAGQRQAADVSMQGAARLGGIRASQAAYGVDVNTGSAARVQQSEREVGQLSALTAENNALLQAYGYRAAATGYTAESGLQTAEAAQAPVGAALSAVGGLAGSASALGYKWNTATGGDAGGTGTTTTAYAGIPTGPSTG